MPERPLEVALQEQCTHHWIIELPNGTFSNGKCKLCGASKEFPNVLPAELEKIVFGRQPITNSFLFRP